MFKFRNIITLSALALAGTAAYFSVMGLGQLFAGAGMSIIVMASILEVSKIVSASLLERYWGILSWSAKLFFTLAVGVLMCITSAGIYGLLSSGYEKTASKLGIHDTEVKLIEYKISNYEKNIESNVEIIDTKRERAKSLSGLRDRQESRLDSLDVKTDWRSRSTANKIRKDITNANLEIKKLTEEVDLLVILNTSLMDSIGNRNIEILEKEGNNEAGAELGPLKYLSELTGKDMDTIISYFILAIIIVFDPLAIALVVVANKLSVKENKVPDDEIKPEPTKEPNDSSVDNATIKTVKVDKIKEEPKVKKKQVTSIPNPNEWEIKDFIGTKSDNTDVMTKKEEPYSVVNEIIPPIPMTPPSGEGLKSYIDKPKEVDKSEKTIQTKLEDNINAIDKVLNKYIKENKSDTIDIYNEPSKMARNIKPVKPLSVTESENTPKPNLNKVDEPDIDEKKYPVTNTMKHPNRNFTVNIPENKK